MNEILEMSLKLTASDRSTQLLIADINKKLELVINSSQRLEIALKSEGISEKITAVELMEKDLETAVILTGELVKRFKANWFTSIRESTLADLPSTLGESEEHDLEHLPHERSQS